MYAYLDAKSVQDVYSSCSSIIMFSAQQAPSSPSTHLRNDTSFIMPSLAAKTITQSTILTTRPFTRVTRSTKWAPRSGDQHKNNFPGTDIKETDVRKSGVSYRLGTAEDSEWATSCTVGTDPRCQDSDTPSIETDSPHLQRMKNSEHK